MLRYCQPTRDLDPAELLLAAVVKRAIRDAQQACNERLRDEAAQWLWTVVPTIARRAELPPSWQESCQLDGTIPTNKLATMAQQQDG